jgi:glucose/mannose transport system permease protein
MMRRIRAWGPGLVLILPSLIALAIFVYGFLGWNLRVSVSSWRGLSPAHDFVGLANYTALFDDVRFTRYDVPNIALFTIVFVAGALAVGFALAALLDRGLPGEQAFRSIYLFPMAISFIAAGIVWRWLMNPAPGDRAAGLNNAFDKLGLGFLSSTWWQDPNWGMSAMAIPAIWALSGYVMALYLAGFRGVPEELREAARMDGASEYRVYRHVVFPFLRPVTLAALIIMGHISIKVFDLVFAIGSKNLISEVPAVYMWVLIYEAQDYAKGAAIAMLLLIAISVLVIPYLAYTVRQERRA